MGTLTKWVFFTLLFSAAPYFVTVALTHAESADGPVFHPSTEVLFIAIVTTSAALGELWHGRDRFRRPSRWRSWWELFLLLGVIISCIHYGAYVHHNIENPGRAAGVDCAVVAGWMADPLQAPTNTLGVSVRREWGMPCAAWNGAQETFWRWSLPATIFWAGMSTLAVATHGPRRKR